MDPMEGLRLAMSALDAWYKERGIFQGRFGFGKSPALVIIDMAYGWTDPAYAGGSERLDSAVAAIAKMLPLAREKKVPIFYTTALYSDQPQFKSAAESVPGFRQWDRRACAIDARLRAPSRRDSLGQGTRQRLRRHHAGQPPARPPRGHPPHHRLLDQRLRPRHRHRRQGLPLAADHHPRSGPGPLGDRPRVDFVRHPGALRRRREPRGDVELPAQLGSLDVFVRTGALRKIARSEGASFRSCSAETSSIRTHPLEMKRPLPDSNRGWRICNPWPQRPN